VPEAFAAIDCGTNSTRLLIVGSSGDTLVREMRITRLGQGVDAQHALAESAVDRTLHVLREYRSLMEDAHVLKARMVATSAVRDATNGDDFLQAASKAVGIAAELIPGDEEGRLAFAGATAGLDIETEDVVVIDIGGGSTELVTNRQDTIHSFSMELGCVRISERCFLHDPPRKDEISAAVAAISSQLDDAITAVPHFRSLSDERMMIGLAGTVSTLAALGMGLPEYDRELVHHSVLSLQSVEYWCETLAGERSSERFLRPGMLEGRQDVIVGGALILREVMQQLGFANCLVSESDILDGLVMSLRP
jgi:exopolyphosphatase/guanosine-5'-triphosphate,3'-diphosphate pyrophosphatase